MRLLIYIILSLLFSACNNHSSEQVSSADTTALSGNNNSKWEIDSLEFIYYPNFSDQRLFKNINVKDRLFLNTLQWTLSRANENFVECSHPVKMFLFNKGNVFKTIYASDSCNYIAYAHNSNQKYIRLQNDVRQKIDSLKLLLQ